MNDDQGLMLVLSILLIPWGVAMLLIPNSFKETEKKCIENWKQYYINERTGNTGPFGQPQPSDYQYCDGNKCEAIAITELKEEL